MSLSFLSRFSRKPRQRSPLPRLVWGALIYNLFVIVWGAYVRASGSGAGCGSHWPLCNGEVLPRAQDVTTVIEFTHRLTSGACLILAAMIAWIGVRDYAKGSSVRRGAWAVLIFTLMEALIGAGLVLLGHVAHDQSMGRAISITLHLINTFLLLASLALTAWWSSFPSPTGKYQLGSYSRRLFVTAIAALALTTLTGMTGAITALGDTLFKSASLGQGFAQDFSATSHFLVRLRVIHPFIAVFTALLLFYFAELASKARPGTQTARLALFTQAFVGGQLVLGVINLVMLAPTSLQLVHLLFAEMVWISLVLTVANALQSPSSEPSV